MKSLLIRTVGISIPAFFILVGGIFGFFQACELLGLSALIPLSAAGALYGSFQLVDLIWDTYFRWASKKFIPEFHHIWFPKDK